jgi:hypothetical protein
MSHRERTESACFILWHFVIVVLLIGLFGSLPVTAAILDTANVMAPLQLKEDNEWTIFENQLTTVKNYGVDAVSVDVWWGTVEGAGDNTFTWSYYDRMFSTIKNHGLKIVPILSFHKCGGNVGDTCDIPLPPWLWTKYVGRTFNGMQINGTDLQYKSEKDNFSEETIALWADALVASEYTDFVNEFKNRFASYNNDFIEINISAGPSGELRYPSYNAHDKHIFDYPSRGGLQSYSRLAVQDFREKMLNKYGNLAGINKAWGRNLFDTNEIKPPSDADYFFSSGNYKNIQYGKDFVDWYNQSLVEHGKTLITTVINALGNSFPSAKIGYKIPGVHWTMGHPVHPRAAEVAAGLIQTSVDFNADTTGHGYANIVSLAKALACSGRNIVLHFTCLEKNDDNVPEQYSLAKTLVFWVANEAQREGVTIKGENALAGDITSDPGWNNIDNAFEYASYTGLTTLRIGEVAAGTGQTRYSNFIHKYKIPSLHIRGSNNNWSNTAMSKNGTVWSLNNVAFGNTSNEGFKFDVYGDWSVNYGRQPGAGLWGLAVHDGENIMVEPQKTYKISFDESSKTYAVTRPNYVGCYTDNSARALPVQLMRSGATTESCITSARAKGYAYAGLQYGGECFAGDTLGFSKEYNDSKCYRKCSANNTEVCGGDWHNSIYATGITPLPQPPAPAYLGCYEDDANRNLPVIIMSSSIGTLETCVAAARARRLKYAGMQFQGQCYAGNTLPPADKKKNDNDCQMPCIANPCEKCGGVWRNAIYDTRATLPQPASSYQGCFKDNINRTLPVALMSSGATVESCVAAATEKGYAYAGVQWGGQCFAGDTLPPAKAPRDSDCNTPCQANNSEKCGGGWLNSVYRTR